MPMSDYLRELREKVGHDLLVLPSAAVALFDELERLLLGKHADREIWVLPGGLVEPGELPADAAVREAWEETGLLIELTGIVGVYGGPDLVVRYENGDLASYVGTVFRGRIIGGQPRPDGSEILELRYFSSRELLNVPHAKWMDGALADIFNPSVHARFQPSTWHP